METVEPLRHAIASIFTEWEKLPRIASNWKIVGVQDTLHDRYETRLLAYLEIREGKIWLLTDNTEEGIASELVSQGVSKDHIVLRFYSPFLREVGEFAVT